jgi:hypothetical protein
MDPGSWRLSSNLEQTLCRRGERGDIIKALHQEMAREGQKRSISDYAIYDPTDADTPARLIGRVVARGLSDELKDRHYLIVDGVDGRAHWIEIGRADATEPTPKGAIVSIAPRAVEVRPSDRTVAEIAAANAGRYSIEVHLRHDPNASHDFAEAHVRRLEALRRARAGVERLPDGTWQIAPDHLDRAAGYERSVARSSPVTVQILSALALTQQVGADGATWLDGELMSRTSIPTRDAGFGREVREALARRRQWLIEQGFACEEQDRVVYRRDLLAVLRRRELTRVAAQLSSELGLAYAEQKPGERIEGIYRRSVELASGKFALIEKSREFMLVPWRPVLERSLGKPVEGIARSDTISWGIGKKRGGPSL